jgi:hypothetical protein
LKRIIVLFKLLFICSIIFGQNIDPDCGKNPYGVGSLCYAGREFRYTTLYITMQPVDKGFGLRADIPVKWDMGVYVSASTFGNYWVSGTYGDIPHYKFEAGLIYYTKVSSMIRPRFTLGLSYHEFWQCHWNADNPKLNSYEEYLGNKKNHFSFAPGVGTVVGKWITLGFRYDFLRCESNVDVGISF